METKKQTSVEWLVIAITNNMTNNLSSEIGALLVELFDEAIAMEKEQHFESYRRGDSFLDANTLDFEGYFEEYYKETYGK